MKKTSVVISTILIIFISLSIFSFTISKAQEVDVSDPSQVIGQEFGINASKIPTSPDQIQQDYLQKEWTNIIANNTYVSPIHRALIKSSPVFLILFGYPYEISLTLLIIFILWLFFIVQSTKIIESLGLVKGWTAILIGIAFAVILAQLKIFKIIATSTLNLIQKSDNWWMHLILWVVVLGVLACAYVFSSILAKNLKEKHKSKVEQESEQKLKEIKGVTEGMHEVSS
ncbi:MAG: hypothetical protein Q7S74_00785 [Nanoarchaeota archaeon]|nr:hypothetical protein [Nanoarchaeota archaeon]